MPMDEEFVHQVSVSLPKKIVRKLRQMRYQSRFQRTMSEIVREAIERYIERLKRGEESLPRLEEAKIRKSLDSLDSMVSRAFYIGERQLKELGDLAARERVTRALLIRLALEKYLGGNEDDEPSEDS